MPASIPYLRDTEIQVDIVREDGDAALPVTFSITGRSDENGYAEFVDDEPLMESGTITLRGTAQTEPGHSRNIRLRAEWDEHEAALSTGFSVCAHPCAVHNGPNYSPHIADDADGRWVGLFVQIRLESDSGAMPDLFAVEDREVLSEPRERSDSMQGNPLDNPEIAGPEQISDFMIDRHRIRWDQVMQYVRALNGTEGHWLNDQLDLFICPRCRMTNYSEVPNSGYRIQRRFFLDHDGRQRHSVSKFPHDAHVTHAGVDYASLASPSDSFETAFDVEYTPPTDIDYEQYLAKMDETITEKRGQS